MAGLTGPRSGRLVRKPSEFWASTPDSFDVSNRYAVTAVTTMHSWMAALQASRAVRQRTWHGGHELYADALLTVVNKFCHKTSADGENAAGRARLFPS